MCRKGPTAELSANGIGQSCTIDDATATKHGLRPIFVYSNVSDTAFESQSQVGQDQVILRLFNAHERNGGETERYFIDLASNDAIELSNTLHLEQNGWRGLCLEPNPIYWYGLAAHRKCLVLGTFVGGTEDGLEVDVSLDNGVFGGIVGDDFDNKPDGQKTREKRNLLTISSALKIANPPKIIDYLSLDVEGAESIVMENFPFDEHAIRFATVERPKKQLRELLERNGFRHVNLTLSSWGETIWYHPKHIALTTREVTEIVQNTSQKVFPFSWRGYPES